MILYLIGIDYKRVPLSIRESIYRNRKEINDFWQDVEEEVAVLFTCNRIEVYGIFEDLFSVNRSICLFQNRFPQAFETAYVKEGTNEVIQHALELSCGLKSQIVGEKEILEQLKSWLRQSSFPLLLKDVWYKVLTYAQDIRFKSGLNEVKNNIARIIFKDVSLKGQKDIIVIGTGRIAQLLAENKPPEVNLHFVSRKRHSRARQLARYSGGKAILLKDLPNMLLKADIVVSATASPHYVLKKKYLSRRKNKLLYLYDLAVPRDIEPEVGNIEGVILKNLDDLDIFFKQHNQHLSLYTQKVQFLIDKSVEILKEEVDECLHQSGCTAQPTFIKTG